MASTRETARGVAREIAAQALARVKKADEGRAARVDVRFVHRNGGGRRGPPTVIKRLHCRVTLGDFVYVYLAEDRVALVESSDDGVFGPRAKWPEASSLREGSARRLAVAALRRRRTRK